MLLATNINWNLNNLKEGRMGYQVKLGMDYQVKLLQRDWIMRLFVLIVSIVIPVIVWFAPYITLIPYTFPAAVPCAGSCIYEFVQSLFVIFLAYGIAQRDRLKGSMEALYARPESNLSYIVGKFLGIGVFFVVINMVVLGICICIQVCGGETVVDPWIYLFYLITFSFPSLCFWAGVSSFVGGLFGNKGGILLVLLLFGASYFCLRGLRWGVFNSATWGVANVFSDMTGHPCLGLYLLHRCCIFLFGVGAGLLSVSVFRRIENRLRNVYCVSIVGGVFLVIGIFAGWKYDRFFVEREIRRATYREVYAKYIDPVKVRILEHGIEYQQSRDSLYSESCIMLQNKSGKYLPIFLLYLNPWLKINELREGGEQVPFEREQQVIVVKRGLRSGEKILLTIDYAGKIDDAFCYLELDETTYNRRELGWDKKSDLLNPFYRFGQCYAFLSEKFTLLYPECLWYPSAAAPENVNMPFVRDMDFTRYVLNVKKKEGMVVISQGRRKECENRFFFENRECLPGISLCIGDFKMWNLTADSLDLELYVYREHDFFMEDLDVPKERQLEVLEEELDRWKRLCSRDYPFREFKVVEVPVSFAVHQRKWNLSNNHVQPGLFFWPERAIVMGIPNFHQWPETWFWTNVNYLSSSKMYNISPMFTDFSGVISDNRYPGMDRLFDGVLKLEEFRRFSSPGTDLLLFCMHYFSGHSLQDAFQDNQLAPMILSYMIDLNASYLNGYLTACSGGKDFRLFLSDFMERHRFGNIEFETLRQEYQKVFGVDMEPVLSALYARKQLPWFRIKDAKTKELGGVTGYGRDSALVEFKVYNDSDVDGVISLYQGTRHRDFVQYNDFLIPAGTCKRICFVEEFMPQFLNFNTRFSRNLPLSFDVNFQEDYLLEGPVGIFDCDSSVFVSPAGEVVVDDRGKGFSYVNPSFTKRLTDFFVPEERNPYLSTDNMYCSKKWTFYLRTRFYGDSIRGAYFKLPGCGEARAMWRTSLEKGEYEIFVYLPRCNERAVRFKKYVYGKIYYYTVGHSGQETAVSVEPDKDTDGWVSLGIYSFDDEEAYVVLDDRVESGKLKDDEIAVVIADAVKWKRVSRSN